MFFILSKTVAFLLLPSNLLFLLVFLGLLLAFTRFRRAGLRIALLSLIVLALIGFLPVGYFLSQVLENRFPPWDPSRGAPDGIVVLGGAIDPNVSKDRGEIAIGGQARRVVALVELARKYPNARIVYSGGSADLIPGGPAEADYLGPLLDTFGVPRARVELENRSRNTAENAAFTRDLIKPRPGERWLLVTSAQHMPRAVGCFRAAGFPIEPYPVDWRTLRAPNISPSNYLAGGLLRTDTAIHEWLGLVAYRLTGRTLEIFPAP